MTTAILGRIQARITDAIDGARSAGAALARSAQEVVECARPEAVSTAAGTSGRADLLDRETVRVFLIGANLARIDGMLSAYGAVLRMLDDVRAEEASVARGRVEREARRDAAIYREAIERDGESEGPEQWANDAFDSWVEDDARAIEPLALDEARAAYLATFMSANAGPELPKRPAAGAQPAVEIGGRAGLDASGDFPDVDVAGEDDESRRSG